MAKKNITFCCMECDEEFTVKVASTIAKNSDFFCVFCGEQIADSEFDDEEDEEPFSDDPNY